MRQIQDIDVLILMATALASKRRPAQLVEVVAAADLLQGFIPFVDKLGEAIRRLSTAGLIEVVDGGFVLTLSAQESMAGLPRKGELAERVVAIKDKLSTCSPQGDAVPVALDVKELTAAILAHKAARKEPGKNLLMPKPQADRHFKVEGRWRRAPAARSRKA